MMKQFLLLLPLAFCCAFALENKSDSTILPHDEDFELNLEPDSIITHGYPAYEGKAPYIVSLNLRRDDSNGLTLCGGSIIAHNWVLTAAHCTNDKHYVDIHYGSNWRWNGQYNHRVRSNNFIQHHLWPNTNGNDIALIRTPHVDFTDRVNRVRLPTFNQRNELFENWWAVTCGWGGQANGQLADWLQCADLQIMSNQECSKSYGNIPIGILCISTPGGKSTCGGDSGGPLVTHDNPILVGVTSFVSSAGCTSGSPAGFTRVTAHLDWIRQHSGVAYY
ncbi:serine protease 1-like [Drosophila sulfurigaster albostrigata]|uniref:serine protease 1-like n=1 Tax=Drosophila sulfurigaster albostrigata TaxID=89887 RepID=UPI002D21A163|nr:serine protease 1-like [Drosophila sulfurigaster albostrigata]